jgi:hypothetical protein
MVLLGVEAEVEACFRLFGDNAHLMQDRCTVCAKHTIGSKIILMHPMEMLGDVVMWNLVSVHLEMVLVLV